MGEQLGERWELRANPSQIMPAGTYSNPDGALLIEIESRLARIETKQDALYVEIHAIRLTVERIDENFQKLVKGVMGAMTSNPLLSRLLGGGRKNAV